jgi:hypothetical protein
LNLRPLHPQCSGPEFEGVENKEVTATPGIAYVTACPSAPNTDGDVELELPAESSVIVTLTMIERLPLSDNEKAEAVRRLLGTQQSRS